MRAMRGYTETSPDLTKHRGTGINPAALLLSRLHGGGNRCHGAQPVRRRWIMQRRRVGGACSFVRADRLEQIHVNVGDRHRKAFGAADDHAAETSGFAA